MTGILNFMLGGLKPSGPSSVSVPTRQIVVVGHAPASYGLNIGQSYEGGFFAGQISTSQNGIATHNLVIAPVSSGQTTARYRTSAGFSNAFSNIDGPTNTANTDNATHPAASYCAGLTINGYSDWYLPAELELQVIYGGRSDITGFNLKPGTGNNTTSFGANAYSVPKRTVNYTTTSPSQTSATDFKTGGAEACPNLLSSTAINNYEAFLIRFTDGYRSFVYKGTFFSARAIRRVAI